MLVSRGALVTFDVTELSLCIEKHCLKILRTDIANDDIELHKL